MFEFVAAVIISMCIGIVAAVVGLGGGFFYVPTLTLIFGLDAKTAVGTSLAVMIFSSSAASYMYLRQGRVLIKVALLLVIPAMIFSLVGTWITTLINAKLLIAIFCIVLILVSLEMLIEQFRFLAEIRIGPSFVLMGQVPHQGIQPIVQIRYLHLIVWGAFGGLVSGVTGTSGGAIFMPALATIGVPVHYAVATSMFSIIAVAITGACAHASLGQVSIPFLEAYGVGAAIGAVLGAIIAQYIQPRHIQKLFGVMLFGIALLMLQQKVFI